MSEREASVTLECPCERALPVELTEAGALASSELPCSSEGCSRAIELCATARGEAGGLLACRSCGHPELFTSKDFPRALGVTIVVAAAALVPFTPYYSSLLAAAVLDALLYHTAPDMVTCYVCKAQHRRYPRPPRHPRFDRTIEERLLYGEQAVMGSPMREGGTADAPEPEH